MNKESGKSGERSVTGQKQFAPKRGVASVDSAEAESLDARKTSGSGADAFNEVITDDGIRGFGTSTTGQPRSKPASGKRDNRIKRGFDYAVERNGQKRPSNSAESNSSPSVSDVSSGGGFSFPGEIIENDNSENREVEDALANGNGENPSDATDGGSSGSESGGGFVCEVDRDSGSYVSPINIAITCSEPATINYCLQIGSGNCDPFAAPVVYSGLIGLVADNTYGLSFYAVSSDTGEIAPTQDFTYIIDSSGLDFKVTYAHTYVQSTQVPLGLGVTSTEFGSDGFFYHQINFKGHDPTSAAGGLNWTCEDMATAYSTLSSPTPIVVSSGFNVGNSSGISAGDTLQKELLFAQLDPGNNYVVTVLEDSFGSKFSCDVTNIVLEDFPIFATTGVGASSVSAGVRAIAGGFVGFGHFENGENSGELKNTQGENVNESGFFGIGF